MGRSCSGAAAGVPLGPFGVVFLSSCTFQPPKVHMKPPPRTRKKPCRAEELTDPSPRVERPWKRAELRSLLSGLRRQARTSDGGDLDYDLLHRDIPSRSVSQIAAEVDRLKKQVISNAVGVLRRRRLEERRRRKPIDEWTQLASAVTGSMEDTINAAFIQMLTEPKPRPLGQPSQHCSPSTVPSPGQGKRLTVVSVSPLVTPTPAAPPGPASAQPRAPVITVLRPLPPRAPLLLLPSPARPTAPFAGAPVRSVWLSVTPGPRVAPPHSHNPTLRFSTPTVLPAARQRPSSPSPSSTLSTVSVNPSPPAPLPVPSCSPPNTAMAHTVNFDNIYRFLSGIQKHSGKHLLTPMESAVVLDLLMSLPQELQQVDCNRLRKHLVKAHRFFSTRAESKNVRRMYEELKRAHGGRSAEPPGGQDGVDRGSEAGNPSAPPASTCCQGEEGEETTRVPPLNPFMIPPELLTRKEAAPC